MQYPKVLTKFALGLTLVAISSPSAIAQGLPTAPYLPLELAQQAANAAMSACIEKGQKVTVTVVDRSGATKTLLKGDGSSPHTVGSSTGKAFASASIGLNTQKLAKFLKKDRELEGLRDVDPRLVILAGGLPIKINGALVGGIGVGGAPSGKIDEACARAGISAIGAQ